MKVICVVALIMVIASCHLEGNYEMDAYFPVTVNFTNKNDSKISIENIINAENSTSLFLIKGKKLQPGEMITARFNYDDADTIRDGLYVISGRCANDKTISSSDSVVIDTHYESQAKLEVEIKGCNSPN